MSEQPKNQNPDLLNDDVEDAEGHHLNSRKRSDYQSDPERKRPDLLEDEDVEAHRKPHGSLLPEEAEDVEGHRKPHGSGEAPGFGSDPQRKRPDLLEDEDVEGHRMRHGGHIQPPRDEDLGGTEH